ncbi:MAG: glycosyltransferase family 4 protein [Candidatus Kerfeldbacteria bacterium]|nr:glycosyltransferase family 4 protein [Candidatus Kerfeldbacteria bacterium]
MRIGIDCRTILNPSAGEKAGVGHYTYYLVKHLLKLDKKNKYVLFFDHRSNSVQEFKRKQVEIIRFPFSEYKRYLPYAYSHVFVTRVLNQANLDLFHSPANVIPLQYTKPAVVTVHDLAIYQHPEWFPPKQDFSVKVLVPRSLAKAKKIIAVSQSTANDIKKQFHIPANHVSVIHEGYEPAKLPSKLATHAVRKKFKLSEQYFFYVGTLEPRKNIAGMIQAFDTLVRHKPRRYKNVQLVLAGAKGYQFQDNYKAIQAVKSGSVRYVGYLSSKDKQALLQGALGFVFPSLYEGFGLPVLEAMAAGTPVITSTVASLPEVAGKAALLINPTSSLALQTAMDKFMSAKVRMMYSKRGKRQAKQFSWERCAKETLKVYDSILHFSKVS